MSVKLSDTAYESALERGRARLSRRHAVRAHYDTGRRLFSVFFSTNDSISFDPHQIDLIKHLPVSALVNATVSPGGAGLLFGAENEHDRFAVSLPGLLNQIVLSGQAHTTTPGSDATPKRARYT